jgi:hypothetical protein
MEEVNTSSFNVLEREKLETRRDLLSEQIEVLRESVAVASANVKTSAADHNEFITTQAKTHQYYEDMQESWVELKRLARSHLLKLQDELSQATYELLCVNRKLESKFAPFYGYKAGL